jgi:hypothetical protein
MELQQLHRIGRLVPHNRVTASIVGIENESQPNGDWLPTSSGSRVAISDRKKNKNKKKLKIFEEQICICLIFCYAVFRRYNLVG